MYVCINETWPMMTMAGGVVPAKRAVQVDGSCDRAGSEEEMGGEGGKRPRAREVLPVLRRGRAEGEAPRWGAGWRQEQRDARREQGGPEFTVVAIGQLRQVGRVAIRDHGR